MPSRELVEEINLTNSLKVLITTYEEISVMRMQRIRDAVLQTRSFIDELIQVFSDVRQAHQTRFEGASIRRMQKQKARVARKKPLLILITTRSRFSGSVVREIFYQFLEEADKGDADIIIAGKVGQEMFAAARPKTGFQYVEMPETRLTAQDLEPLVQAAVRYKNVRIFYGRFNNLIDQIAAETNLSDAVLAQEASPSQEKSGQKLHFLFEPSLGEVVAFFDNQILGALVAQAAHESQLAVLGSRVTSMEDASQRVNDKLDELQKLERLLAKAKQNREQRDLMAGMTLWK